MPATPYDLVVIGAGPGGYIAAIRAAQLGMRVACVDKDPSLGGTCLNVGCIPSKALLDSSERYYQAAHDLAAHGIRVNGIGLDIQTMLARKDQVVKTLTRGIASLFRKHRISTVTGVGRLVGAGRVEVHGNEVQTLAAAKILIASGSAPIELPSAPFDGQRIISSTEALTLTAVPKRMMVIGGGAVGLELGSVWSRLGAQVLVVELLDRVVPGMDEQLAGLLKRALKKQGLDFRLRTTLRRAAVEADGVLVQLSAGDSVIEERCDVLLVAVGRRPYTDGLGLETIGIELDERGRIPVDAQFATAARDVYAIGDVIAGPMLAHKAEEEGVAAVEHMAGMPGHVNYEAIPNIVYTTPELASVGLTEEEARRRGFELRVGAFPYAANGRARCMGETDGMVKVVADATTDRVLGVHILGPHASDVIGEAALAMEFSASAEDIGRAVHAHPTLSEALKEAALAVDGRPLSI
ncbi:MAG: dihydrolipoyl dehydrogenase [Candidatus Binatia bacterium]